MSETAHDLWRLVYVSSATALLAEPELDELLAVARRNNTARGITGLLLYHDGNFLQALEGPRQEIRDLEATIRSDPRHRGMLTLVDGALDARQFGEWSMAFRHLGRTSLPPGHSGLLDEGLTAEHFRAHPDRVHRVLQTFADTQLRRPRRS